MTCAAVGNWPATQDLRIQQGDGFSLLCTLKQSGAPIDLVGATFKAQARKRARDSVVAFEFVCTVQTPTTDGKVLLSLSAATTAAIVCDESPNQPASQYTWDLQMSVSGGDPVTLLAGRVYVRAEVTRV